MWMKPMRKIPQAEIEFSFCSMNHPLSASAGFLEVENLRQPYSCEGKKSSPAQAHRRLPGCVEDRRPAFGRRSLGTGKRAPPLFPGLGTKAALSSHETQQSPKNPSERISERRAFHGLATDNRRPGSRGHVDRRRIELRRLGALSRRDIGLR